MMEMDSIKHEYRRHRRRHAAVELAATRRLLRRVAIRVSSVYSYACELHSETLQQAVRRRRRRGGSAGEKNQHN
jgi:hypothetical protein